MLNKDFKVLNEFTDYGVNSNDLSCVKNITYKYGALDDQIKFCLWCPIYTTGTGSDSRDV